MAQGLIIKGISGSGKTAVLKRIMDQTLHNHAPSQVILTEHHTQRVLELKEQQGTLQSADHLKLLERC